MGEALKKDVFPEDFDLQLERISSEGKPITLPFLEELFQPGRRALGLKYGHLLGALHRSSLCAPQEMGRAR